MQTDRILCDENNRVTIRIWTSESNRQYPGQNVGHVSIETTTPKSYISFWPVPFTYVDIQKYQVSGKLDRKILKYFGERDAQYMTSYMDDYEKEGKQEPQLVICLYGLDAENIIIKFNELKNEIGTWRLIGSNLLVQNIETVASNVTGKLFETNVGKKNIDNCSSIAYKLLKAGGLYDEVSSSFSFKFSSSVTPDDLADAVIAAKNYEHKKFSEIKQFIFVTETDVVKKESSCLIM